MTCQQCCQQCCHVMPCHAMSYVMSCHAMSCHVSLLAWGIPRGKMLRDSHVNDDLTCFASPAAGLSNDFQLTIA